ncbi:MAG: BON domain-containing protein [Chloroflexi bacterium]|nr:BON domain-containing protein [Chloroflexota bacterium]
MRRRRATWTAPWIEVVFGGRVDAPSGKLGWVTGAVVKLRERELTHVIIRRAVLFGLIGAGTIALPAAWIEQQRPGRLACNRDVGRGRSPEQADAQHTRATAQAQPVDLRQLSVRQPGGSSFLGAADWRTERGFSIVERGTDVWAVSRRVGLVERLLLHPRSKHITHVVVRSHPLDPRVAALPIEWIRKIAHNRLYLDTRLEQMSGWPAYPPKTDRDMEERIAGALASHAPTALGAIGVRVAGRTVELSGIVPTLTMRQVAEQIARRESGGLSVENRLEIDSDIAGRISLALDHQLGAAAAYVRVSSLVGEVRLEGTVATPELRQRVEEIAAHAATPATSVYNLVEVQPPEPPLEHAVMFGLPS